METGYKVDGNRVLNISVQMTFDEILRSLEDSSGRGHYNLLDQIRQRVAQAISDEFLKNHTTDILKAMDPAQIANLATLNVLRDIRGGK